MYSDGLALLLGLAVFVWLLVLSFLIWKENNFLRSLFPKSGERDIRKKFEEVISKIEEFNGRVNSLEDSLKDLRKDGLGHIQKVALIRYNPFRDSGGDQSFSVTLLDKNGTGVVVTSLHGRESTRIFAKDVDKGKRGRYEFSKEEKEVIEKALQS